MRQQTLNTSQQDSPNGSILGMKKVSWLIKRVEGRRHDSTQIEPQLSYLSIKKKYNYLECGWKTPA